MKIEFTSSYMKAAMLMFLSAGAMAHGIVVLSYALWFLGYWPE